QWWKRAPRYTVMGGRLRSDPGGQAGPVQRAGFCAFLPRFLEVCAAQIGPAEISALEIGAQQDRIAEIGSSENRILEIGIGEDRIAELRACQHLPREIMAGEVHMGEIGAVALLLAG